MIRSAGRLAPLAAALLLLLARPAFAPPAPGEMLSDPALEARARAIGRGLRCLVCQNQSIDDSDADLARDLRRLVRERLVAGDSDAAAVEFVRARYGDYILLRPPVKPVTWLLWFGPAALLLVGGGLVAAFYRGRSAEPPADLDADERARLARLIADEPAR